MPILPVGEWLPDQPDFDNPGASTVLNVVPQTKQSYGPMPTPVAGASGPLTARCQGAYSLTDDGANVYNFAADANRIYLLKFGSTSFVDVSKAGGGPYATPAIPEGFWSATSFGERVIFTNGVDPIQSFLVGTDAAFSDLSPNAPKALYCCTIRDFLMLGNIMDDTGVQPRRLRWPAIGDPTNFPQIGSNAAIEVQSDNQDLEQSDLGAITGLIGGHLSSADGAAFMEYGIYRIQYVGSPDIFQFTVAEGAAGTQSPLSIVQHRLRGPGGVAAVASYLGTDDFYAFDGMTSIPLGDQKWAKAFYRDLDATYQGFVQGIADPINKLVFWAYHGPASGGFYNRLLVYNWDLNRGALCDLSATPAEWFTRSLSIGYSLDQLDLISTNLDALPYSLDSRVWTGGKPVLSLFDTAHQLNYTTGPALAPTVDTSEKQLFPSRRARVMSGRPLVDGGTASIAMAGREQLTDAITYQAAIPVNIIGECPQKMSGRYLRARITLPAGSSFNHIQGVDLTAAQDSMR